ncbi:conserved hypothetical protein [Hyella patelloides LEGE 07179]|uniref:DUF433 domain-containing protein n=1 Tax=Hyella patelloides LEGE 07179 TaxID=945734 RepID=A0A563W3C8_9CYAN|nr:DUF433 domain-containing protein [Hyella patelloides]VEP18155.1 conserved hypothetical protein [Hyella patelloides LEGE 07179]
MVTTIDIGTLIVSTPDVCFNRPRIAGKRFSVEQIASLNREGLSPKQIKDEYDFLSLAEIYAALAYYYANQEQIEQYLAEDKAEYQKLSVQSKTNQK